MNERLSGEPSGTALDSERLLALSSLLSKGSREFESSVRGRSMGSILPDGSRIRISFATGHKFVAGQIVAYVAKDRIVAHRLLRCATSHGGHYLITRGDATLCCDLPVLASSVIGIVSEFWTDGSWQPVGPQCRRWFGFRWTASVISGMVAVLVKLNPGVATWMAGFMIRIHSLGTRISGFLMRHLHNIAREQA
jgi:hypothetical protein